MATLGRKFAGLRKPLPDRFMLNLLYFDCDIVFSSPTMVKINDGAGMAPESSQLKIMRFS